MTPIQIMTNSATSTYGRRRLKRDQSMMGMIEQARMISPPIVGVVPFEAWLSGVPSRTT
jgi:hypothetical protein